MCYLRLPLFFVVAVCAGALGAIASVTKFHSMEFPGGAPAEWALEKKTGDNYSLAENGNIDEQRLIVKWCGPCPTYRPQHHAGRPLAAPPRNHSELYGVK